MRIVKSSFNEFRVNLQPGAGSLFFFFENVMFAWKFIYFLFFYGRERGGVRGMMGFWDTADVDLVD